MNKVYLPAMNRPLIAAAGISIGTEDYSNAKNGESLWAQETQILIWERVNS